MASRSENFQAALLLVFFFFEPSLIYQETSRVKIGGSGIVERQDKSFLTLTILLMPTHLYFKKSNLFISIHHFIAVKKNSPPRYALGAKRKNELANWPNKFPSSIIIP